jgi:hypothetical protein
VLSQLLKFSLDLSLYMLRPRTKVLKINLGLIL